MNFYAVRTGRGKVFTTEESQKVFIGQPSSVNHTDLSSSNSTNSRPPVQRSMAMTERETITSIRGGGDYVCLYEFTHLYAFRVDNSLVTQHTGLYKIPSESLNLRWARTRKNTFYISHCVLCNSQLEQLKTNIVAE